MRAVAALALVVVLMVACGGGASPSEIRVAPAVTTAPTADPNAAGTPKPSGGYDYGY
ncbi:MAG: hypothetical protein HYU87_04555 [Chloroflexi bacterium]|nr:hypothetical protein [Chloroflexota bacterium]